MRTLGLCIIIKNEKENLKRLLSSVEGVVDTVYLTDTGSTDGSIEEAERICEAIGLKLEVSHYEWNNNFSKARNFNFSQAKTDWILWLDGDDELINGRELRSAIEERELSGGTGGVMLYEYQNDTEGNPLNDHDKLRVVKNGVYSWTFWERNPEGEEVSIHENLFPYPNVEYKDFYIDGVYVTHYITEEGKKDSQARNLRILKEQEIAEGKNRDPRTVFLLGRELDGNGMYDEAIPYLKEFVGMEGTKGETLHACSLLSKIYEKKGMFKEQLKWGYTGIMAHPGHPLGYLRIAEAFRNRGEWENVVDAVLTLRKKKVGKMESLAYSMFSMEKPATLELANAYKELKEFDKAREEIATAVKSMTKAERKYIQPALREVIAAENKDKQERAVRVLANTLIQGKAPGLLPKLEEIIPPTIKHTSSGVDISRIIGHNKLWNKGNIVIYAHTGIEEWDEDSLEKGIGGSETAVIEMAKRWGKAGYTVTVYGDVSKEKVFGNATYLPASEMNFADQFDIFVSWRNVDIFKDADIVAKKKYLWLHDVPNPADYTREVCDKIDKIIVLSKYHRSLLPDVPDEKIYVSRNGIDSEAIEKLGDIKRNPKKVIYASQPVRGLEKLLDMWEDVVKEVPDAELVWAYGWDNYDIMIQKGVGSLEFKEEMVRRMKELGVKDLGRLGKEELYKEFKSSTIWAYPTEFPEISCIVAMEAQAAGCYPITTGYAALTETQKIGEEVGLKEFKERLILNLQDYPSFKSPDPEVFGWNGIAKEWMNDLFYGVEIENYDPLVTVVHVTGRKGGLGMLKRALEKQTYKNMELVIIDKLYHERVAEVADYFSDLKIPYLHLPDPPRDKVAYKYGLCHAHNAALFVANGELLVFLQDFFDVKEDGVEKFVNLYKYYPNSLLAGIDEQHLVKVEEESMLDNFDGRNPKWGKKVWTSMWSVIPGGRRISVSAREWELNWSAAPKSVLEKLGGWNKEWDKGYGWDNVDISFRYIEMGGDIVIDESNKAKGIKHENLWGEKKEDENTDRFMAYASATRESPNPYLVAKLEEPQYAEDIKDKINKFKQS